MTGMTEQYPRAYVEYLLLFHAYRDYFECHEVLEQQWKRENQEARAAREADSMPGKAWVALIQTAVALYHHRRGNVRGAAKMMESAVRNTASALNEMSRLGIDGPRFLRRLDARRKQLREDPPVSFSDLDIPLADKDLEAFCIQECEQRGVRWGAPSDSQNDWLIHKHKRRDRSGIIRERLEQQRLKQMSGKRQNARKNIASPSKPRSDRVSRDRAQNGRAESDRGQNGIV
jgi:hypothetical protein